MVADSQHSEPALAESSDLEISHVATSSPLPPLSRQDRDFLLFYFAHDEDPIAAANASGGNYIDILCWTSQPHIAAYLAHARRLRLQHQRDRALAALEDLLRRADDPIERRRVATTILRATDPARWNRLRRQSEPSHCRSEDAARAAASRPPSGSAICTDPSAVHSPGAIDDADEPAPAPADRCPMDGTSSPSMEDPAGSAPEECAAGARQQGSASPSPIEELQPEVEAPRMRSRDAP